MLSVLPNLHIVTLTTICQSFAWADEEELEFLEDVTRLASSTLNTFTLDYPYYPSVCTTWNRVGDVWTISHRKRQEPTIERRLELEREAWKQKCISEITGGLLCHVFDPPHLHSLTLTRIAHYKSLRGSSAQKAT